MSRSYGIHVAWAAACAGAFALGGIKSAPSQPAVSSKGPISKASAAETQSAESNGGLTKTGGRTPSAPTLEPEVARARAFEILSEPNPTTRMRAFCDLLDQMTPENWKAIKDAFVKQTIHAGRTHDVEWVMMWKRLGEVGAAPAVDEQWDLNVASSRSNAGMILEGWAGSDGEAALRWFRAQPDDKQDRLWPNFFTGFSRTNPKEALNLMLQQPQEVWEPTMRTVIQGAFTQGGFQAADELVDAVVTRPDVDMQLKRKVVYEVGQKRLASARLSGEPMAPLAWFERFVQPDSPIGAAITQQVVTMAAAADPQKTFNWVQAHEASMPAEQAAAAYPAVALIMEQQAPAVLADWLSTHPDHPYRKQIEAALKVSQQKDVLRIDSATVAPAR